MLLSSTNRFATLLILLALPVFGDVTGTIRLKGQPPQLSEITPAHDTEVCGEQLRPLRWLTLGTNQTVAGAIVYLGTPCAKETPAQTATLDLRNCELLPRIQIVKAAKSVTLINSDPVLHVVQLDLLSGTNAPQNLAVVAAPYAGFRKQIEIPAQLSPAILRMTGLNGHEWLTAYVAVLPFQWSAMTDTNGQFTLTGVRAGVYKIYAWHEALGTLTGEVKVGTNQAAHVDLEFTTVVPQPSD
jgi:hypothetical protein